MSKRASPDPIVVDAMPPAKRARTDLVELSDGLEADAMPEPKPLYVFVIHQPDCQLEGEKVILREFDPACPGAKTDVVLEAIDTARKGHHQKGRRGKHTLEHTLDYIWSQVIQDPGEFTGELDDLPPALRALTRAELGEWAESPGDLFAHGRPLRSPVRLFVVERAD
jgi:hypothetical protein